MRRPPFLTFLTFLTQKLCCRVSAGGPRQYLGILPYTRRERLEPPTVGPDGGDTITRSERRRLPDRRGHELLNFEHGGIRYTAGAGRFDNGGLAEIFLTTAKHGTAVDVNARDAAVAASLLLQRGCPVEVLRRALTRNADGSASGALAHALDLLEEGT
jgi:ribonucleoside-diphosphate reductase alpha chain